MSKISSSYFMSAARRVKRPHVSIEYEKQPSQEEQVKWQPKGWEKILENIKAMRKQGGAPVDTVGCDNSFDKTKPGKEQRFQVLVSLMLSSQTKDEVNHAACVRLQAAGLTSPRAMLDVSSDRLGELIKPVGFWRRKTDFLKRVSQILIDDYKCDIPASVEDLCRLPGVGPKMAHLVMQVAWNQCTGIAVDTHVHRISNRLKWVSKETKNPIDTERELESWIPRELWSEINHLLVGFGQTICSPVNPHCNDCLNKDVCPSARSFSTKKARKK